MTSRKIYLDGGMVMLAGYRSQHPNTVDVIAARGRVTLLVVPPEASAQTVQAARMAAGQGGNTDDVETLLRSSSGHPAGLGHVGGEAEAAQQRWEVDGGRAFMNR